MADELPISNPLFDALGPTVRQLRMERGDSLRVLAGRAGVSASLLSDIERGKVNPTVATLFALAAALGVPAQRFFGAVPGMDETGKPRNSSDESAVVVRATDRRSISLTGGITWQRLTPHAGGKVEFMEMRYEPKAVSGADLHHHAGREYGLVLEGELTLQLGFDVHVLRAGDSIAFDSMTPHRLSNRGQTVLRLAWVNIHQQDGSGERPGPDGQ